MESRSHLKNACERAHVFKKRVSISISLENIGFANISDEFENEVGLTQKNIGKLGHENVKNFQRKLYKWYLWKNQCKSLVLCLHVLKCIKIDHDLSVTYLNLEIRSTYV